MKPKAKIHEIDQTNDKKYLGPLTYQHFRIVGWLLIALSQIAVILSIGQKMHEAEAADPGFLRILLTILGSVAMPLLLIANFAVILSGRTGYKKLLIRFGALSAGVIAAFMLVYERYAIGIASINSTRSDGQLIVDSLLSGSGFIAFNMFLDLFLCTLVMFFLDYIPKKHFQGKKLIVFRLFALIPIIYELLAVTFKILAGLKLVKLPVPVFPFLTTKSPTGFLVFVALALFIKRRERKYLKGGKTLADYKTFLGTNANSWHFSVHAAIIMVVAAILDFVVIVAFSVIETASIADPVQAEIALTEALTVLLKCGFGESLPFIIVAPIMLLFSYTRQPKRPQLDKFIPMGGVALIAVIYIEGIFLTITA